jgi:hypothetical protein
MQITASLLGSLLALLVSQNGATYAADSEQTSEVGETVKGDYLAEEKFQLTDASLPQIDEIDPDHASLFYPENASKRRSLSSRTARKCKTFPGDFLWPKEPVWKLLDLITGGALVKTVPIAASCYNNLSVYDKARCSYVVDNWSSSSLQ